MDHSRFDEDGSRHLHCHAPAILEHRLIKGIDYTEQRDIAALDPRQQIVREVRRRDDSSVSEQFDNQAAYEFVVRLADSDLGGSREPRSKVG